MSSKRDTKTGQRNYPRIPTRSFVAFEVPEDNPGFYRLGLAKSLSKGGMAFELDHSFPPGKLLNFQFTLEDDLIEARGIVIYTLERQPGHFDIGVKFLDISDADAESLASWFRRHGGAGSPADPPAE
ncbi:MAG TPA: PilZ domain-containing protein [Acidobacteriota bacterium]